MNRKLIGLFLCVLVIVSGFLGSSGSVSSLVGNDLDGVSTQPAKRSLLSILMETLDFKLTKNAFGMSLSLIVAVPAAIEHDTALVAALDGTIHLVEPKSGKDLWSFISGPSIYSSYQATVEHDDDDDDKENISRLGSFFIDCGDDWALYMNDAFGKRKLKETIEEFISNTPLIAEDGGVVLGSKKTTVFLVDAKTGKLIYTYNMSDPPPTSQSNVVNSVLNSTTFDELGQSGSLNFEPDELPLYITRTDYSLKSFALNTDKVLWNMTVAEIGAAYLCQDTENSFSGALSDSESEFPPAPGVNFSMPLPCQSKAVVYRFHRHNMLGPFYKPNMLPEAHDEEMMLPESNSKHGLHWQPPKVDKLPGLHGNDEILSLPAPNEPYNNNIDLGPSVVQMTENSGISVMQDVKMRGSGGLNMVSKGSSGYSLISLVITTVCLVPCLYFLMARKDGEGNKQPNDLNASTVTSKRKKIRRSGKNNGRTSSGDGYDERPWLKLNQGVDESVDGRTIGKLFVSNREIAKGSNGTIVLEGIYEGRPVAVKRLVKTHHDVAFKEIQNLIASDRHPNIVRWYGVESDQDFVYLSLERCTCSLSDLIQTHLDAPTVGEDQATEVKIEYKIRFESMEGTVPEVKLWTDKGYPSPMLLKLMRDVVSGLVHLHELGIVHRDLKPQNVLIIKDRSLLQSFLIWVSASALLGICLPWAIMLLASYGSSGWQAPEQLLHGRQTRAVDMFSLGCVLFYCITGGRHPFGDRLERDINIVKSKADLFLVEYIPEAVDFDRVELEDREADSDLLKALESIAPLALGTKWDEKMEPAFLNNIGKYRRYKFDSVRDLLRVMRNKLNHYRELPLKIQVIEFDYWCSFQEILGPVPEGFDGYFGSRFPKLLMEVYKVLHKYCREEEGFNKYFKASVV
ncbi:hypothetical protein C3L33_17889, partial [Rhododendron williamsianum]